MQVREVDAQLYQMETKLPVVEVDGGEDQTADEACQQLLDDQEN